MGPLGAIRPEMAEATHAMRAAINQSTIAGVANMSGYHGLWEPGIARGGTAEDVTARLRKDVTDFSDAVSQAMVHGESFFIEHLWPEQLPHIERALKTLHDWFVPPFPTMARSRRSNSISSGQTTSTCIWSCTAMTDSRHTRHQ